MRRRVIDLTQDSPIHHTKRRRQTEDDDEVTVVGHTLRSSNRISSWPRLNNNQPITISDSPPPSSTLSLSPSNTCQFQPRHYFKPPSTSPPGKCKTPMPIVISPTSTTSKTHVHDRHLPRFGGPSSSSGATAPALVPIERDPKIAKFVNLFEETVGVRHSDGVTPVHRKHVDVSRPKTAPKPAALPPPPPVIIPNHTYFPGSFSLPPIANAGAHGLGVRPGNVPAPSMGAMNWPSSNPHISPYSSTPLLPGRATHPPHMQRVEPLRQYSVFGGAASAPNAIRHRPGPYQNVASGVRQEAKASTSRAKKTISAAHPPATSLPVAPLPPAHTYFNQPADYSHPFSDYLRTMQGLPADQAAMNRLHALASNPAFQPPFPMTSGIPFKADDNPDDNCPVCGVKIVGVLSKMDEERHLRICFGDEEPEPLPVPVVDVKHVSKRLRGSKNESVQGMTKSKDARPAAPPPLKLVGNTFVVRKCTKAGDECQICMEEFELSDSVAILNCFCVYHEQCIKDWFQTKEKKKEPKACPTHGE